MYLIKHMMLYCFYELSFLRLPKLKLKKLWKLQDAVFYPRHHYPHLV
jgi:hypothetical protein